jgi:hypothetical protein
MCWDIDPNTGIGHCVVMCTESTEYPTCPECLDCLISGDGILTLCRPGCSPLLQAWDLHRRDGERQAAVRPVLAGGSPLAGRPPPTKTPDGADRPVYYGRREA